MPPYSRKMGTIGFELSLTWSSPDFREDLQRPPIVYHYTNAAGFFAIIESGACLHASHYRFLNDTGEVTFGLEASRRVLVKLQDRIGERLARKVDHDFDKLRDEDVFVACLSKNHDVLSQWRHYADNGAGYCLGFRSRERLEGYGDDDAFWSNHLVRCVYGKRALERRLFERFNDRLDHIEKGKARRGLDKEKLIASELTRVARRYSHLAKHDHFKEEREWRYLVGAPDSEIRYRVGVRGLTPYLSTDPLPLERIWVGPGVRPSPEVASRAVERFLARNKIQNVKVDVWDSPFRG